MQGRFSCGLPILWNLTGPSWTATGPCRHGVAQRPMAPNGALKGQGQCAPLGQGEISTDRAVSKAGNLQTSHRRRGLGIRTSEQGRLHTGLQGPLASGRPLTYADRQDCRTVGRETSEAAIAQEEGGKRIVRSAAETMSRRAQQISMFTIRIRGAGGKLEPKHFAPCDVAGKKKAHPCSPGPC